MYIDYRSLNQVIVKDESPFPLIDELLDELHGAMYFWKRDIGSGYHKMGMHEEDIPKSHLRNVICTMSLW